jgi:RNA polymerase sigma-70 factor (ECF subfamily)
LSAPRTEDADLIARVQAGDRRAFEELVGRHEARIEGLARRFLGDEHEARDVVQEVFLAAFKVLPSWKREAEFFTWLYRTTLNLCSARLRKRGRLRTGTVPEGASAAVDPGRRAELAEALLGALSKLSDRQREIFLACHEQGTPLSVSARRLGISLGAAKSHLHRALITLRDDLRLRKLL